MYEGNPGEIDYGSSQSVPGVQIVGRGRKIHKKKKRGETRGEKGEEMPVNILLQSFFRPY